MNTIECAGQMHHTGMDGHDGAPAAYIVDAHCPACGKVDKAAMCAGRVAWIEQRDPHFACGDCGHTAHWRAMWTLQPISLEPIAHADSPNDDLIRRYADQLRARGRASGTVQLRTWQLRKLADAFPDLTHITPAELEAWIHGQSAGKKPSTINNTIKAIRSFYGWAERFDVVTPNPSTRLDLLPNPHRMGRIAQDEQIRAALAAATPALRAMLLLGRQCGLRVSEIASLHTDNVDGDWLTIVGKGSKQRRQHMVPGVRDALAAIRPLEGGYYFPGRNGHPHMLPASAGKVISRATGLNAHSLRHAAATAVYDATKDLRATQDFLGHSTSSTTAIYVHVTDDTLRAAAEAGAMADDEENA